MDDIDHCLGRLRNLAEHAQTDPREQAKEIVRSFTAQAAQDDINRLKHRVLDELTVKTRAQVPQSHLMQHSRRLAVLEAAKAALS